MGSLKRWGVRLGVLALLVQCLVATLHQPARAATPFDDPAAWCLSGDSGSTPDFGHTKEPLKAPPCAICQTLVGGGIILTPEAFALAAPRFVILSRGHQPDEPTIPARLRSTASPRGPPQII